jgi:hypothetical protein
MPISKDGRPILLIKSKKTGKVLVDLIKKKEVPATPKKKGARYV